MSHTKEAVVKRLANLREHERARFIARTMPFSLLRTFTSLDDIPAGEFTVGQGRVQIVLPGWDTKYEVTYKEFMDASKEMRSYRIYG